MTDRWSDDGVRGTNDDAQISKLSCVDLGYFQDDFVRYFVRRPQRRPPLINRGYYSRAAALRGLIQQFMTAAAGNAQRQVVSLGAGFDTTWMHMKAAGKAPEKYIEVDLREVTSKKASIMRSTEAIARLIEPQAVVDLEAGCIASAGYALQPADLRDVGQLQAALAAAGLQPEAPTLVLLECVLVYLDAAEAAAVVAALGRMLPNAVCIVYEQIKPDDAFGQQMLRNLQGRGCPLRGLPATPDLQSQCRRFTDNGWKHADARDMATVYRTHLDPADRLRAERLEIFDEFEEWNMIQEHYCIALGINDRDGTLARFGFQLPKPQVVQLPGGRTIVLNQE